MVYHEIKPGNRLRKYVQCYYVYESASAVSFDDTVFPSGCMELIFNLGTGKWQTDTENGFVTHPPVELWGQIIRPLTVRSLGKNTMLGIRFLPHGAACFINDKADLFNNQVVDFKQAGALYQRLQETPAWNKRIELLETFLWEKVTLFERRLGKMSLVGDILVELRKDDFFDNMENVAGRYGITARYLQKLFLQYTGLTPKLYSQIHRFQNSLRLVAQKDSSLTSIAYECGYFDQSHFIKEFKSFTGFTPSGYSVDNSPVTLALASN